MIFQHLSALLKDVISPSVWLTGKNQNGEPNNFLYSDIQIDMERLAALPDNGFIELSDLQVNSSNEPENDNEEEENELLPDFGPVNNEDDDEHVFDKNTEMSSFLPSKFKKQKEADLTKDEILNNSKTEIDIKSKCLLSIYNYQYKL